MSNYFSSIIGNPIQSHKIIIGITVIRARIIPEIPAFDNMAGCHKLTVIQHKSGTAPPKANLCTGDYRDCAVRLTYLKPCGYDKVYMLYTFLYDLIVDTGYVPQCPAVDIHHSFIYLIHSSVKILNRLI